MFKKVLVASLAVVIGLAVLSKTGLGHKIREAIRSKPWASRNTPEKDMQKEIARLRAKIENLQKQDDQYEDKVAHQRLEVKELERKLFTGDPQRKIAGDKVRLEELRNRITELRALVKNVNTDKSESGPKFVSYKKANDYTVKQAEDQIAIDYKEYKPLKVSVQSQEEYLAQLREALALNEQTLGSLEKTRKDMMTQLQGLENRLVKLRQNNASRVADPGYAQAQKDIDALKHRMAVAEEKATIKGAKGKGPIEASEEARARQVEAQKEMDAEFGGAVKATDAPKN